MSDLLAKTVLFSSGTIKLHFCCNTSVTQPRDTTQTQESKIIRRYRMKRFAGFLLAALVVAGTVWAQGALLINGAGASFPNAIYSKWFDEYHKKFSNIQINYQSVGSGAGIKQVTEGTVDFGASDGPMNDD